MIIVQHVVGVNLLDLRYRPDIPRDDRVGFLVILALQMKDMP